MRAWSVIPIRVAQGHHSVTLVTSMFLHASWMHIIGNMVFLWAFGPEMEDAMGPISFLVFYLAGGAVAMLAQVLGDPFSTFPAWEPAGPLPRSWAHSSSLIPATASAPCFSS